MVKRLEGACRSIVPPNKYALPACNRGAGGSASNLAARDGVRYGLRVPGRSSANCTRTPREGIGAEVPAASESALRALVTAYYDAYYFARRRCGR